MSEVRQENYSVSEIPLESSQLYQPRIVPVRLEESVANEIGPPVKLKAGLHSTDIIVYWLLNSVDDPDHWYDVSDIPGATIALELSQLTGIARPRVGQILKTAAKQGLIETHAGESMTKGKPLRKIRLSPEGQTIAERLTTNPELSKNIFDFTLWTMRSFAVLLQREIDKEAIELSIEPIYMVAACELNTPDAAKKQIEGLRLIQSYMEMAIGLQDYARSFDKRAACAPLVDQN